MRKVVVQAVGKTDHALRKIQPLLLSIHTLYTEFRRDNIDGRFTFGKILGDPSFSLPPAPGSTRMSKLHIAE